jgi:hypothetical protein
MGVPVEVDDIDNLNSSSSSCEDFMVRDNSESPQPTLRTFIIEQPPKDNTSRELIKNVSYNKFYETNFLHFKLHLELFIKKYLKEKNNIFIKYEHIKVTQGSTATYRCKNYRNKELKCKGTLKFKYILKTDSVVIFQINYSNHLDKCM